MHHTLRDQWENQIEFNRLHSHKGPINKVVAGGKKGGYEGSIDFRNKIRIDPVSREKMVYTSCSELLYS